MNKLCVSLKNTISPYYRFLYLVVNYRQTKFRGTVFRGEIWHFKGKCGGRLNSLNSLPLPLLKGLEVGYKRGHTVPTSPQ